MAEVQRAVLDKMVEFVRQRKQGVPPRTLMSEFGIKRNDWKKVYAPTLLTEGLLDATGVYADRRYHHPDNQQPIERPVGVTGGKVIVKPSASDKLLEVFETFPNRVLARAELVDLADMPSRTLDKCISRLMDEKKIKRVAMGRYLIASSELGKKVPAPADALQEGLGEVHPVGEGVGAKEHAVTPTLTDIEDMKEVIDEVMEARFKRSFEVFIKAQGQARVNDDKVVLTLVNRLLDALDVPKFDEFALPDEERCRMRLAYALATAAHE